MGLEVSEGVDQGGEAGQGGGKGLIGVRNVNVGVVGVARLAHLGAEAFEGGADVVVEGRRECGAEVGGRGLQSLVLPG